MGGGEEGGGRVELSVVYYNPQIYTHMRRRRRKNTTGEKWLGPTPAHKKKVGVTMEDQRGYSGRARLKKNRAITLLPTNYCGQKMHRYIKRVPLESRLLIRAVCPESGCVVVVSNVPGFFGLSLQFSMQTNSAFELVDSVWFRHQSNSATTISESSVWWWSNIIG